MAVKYMKIDFLKVRRFLWMLLVPFFALFFVIGKPDVSMVFSIGYGMFIGMLFCEFPFNSEQEQEVGFLKMLPSRNGDDIRGHFLFGLVILPLYFALGFLVAGIGKLINPEISVFSWNGQNICGIYLAMFGVSFAMTGIEYLLFTIFRYSSAQMLQILRVVPALVFFFLMFSFSGNMSETASINFGAVFSGPVPVLFLAAGVGLYFLLGVISVRISKK